MSFGGWWGIGDKMELAMGWSCHDVTALDEEDSECRRKITHYEYIKDIY
jgi:hypothetical protein